MRPGLGLANKAGAAIELLNASGATKILLSMGADALINAGVSGGSQYAKDGSVDLGRVVIDTFAGVVGSIASREVMSTSQGSQTASKLALLTQEKGDIPDKEPSLMALNERVGQYKMVSSRRF